MGNPISIEFLFAKQLQVQGLPHVPSRHQHRHRLPQRGLDDPPQDGALDNQQARNIDSPNKKDILVK